MAESNNRRAGKIYIKADGVLYDAKGDYSYGLGLPKRDAIIGSDGVHGYKETPQVAFIEGAITDKSDLDLETLATADNQTITLELANGKVIVLSDAWYASEGSVTTGEAEIAVRWESRQQAVENK